MRPVQIHMIYKIYRNRISFSLNLNASIILNEGKTLVQFRVFSTAVHNQRKSRRSIQTSRDKLYNVKVREHVF